ncbi:MAG TPA: sulfate adenylyltransferase subunit CysN [Microvirga sp.]|nr:sulfate adenylyltransferase subunit CysN [Microvirga sp.]
MEVLAISAQDGPFAGDGGVPLLRLLTCGAVDDGKSTLIGRLLYDTRQIFEDHLSALSRESRRYGTTGDELDLALLLDGLEAEREQGITIDVAYRFFKTPGRSFIVADTPGHEQYTRNMATGASNSDLAVILVDARKGILTQTRRHSYICSLLGIRHVILAVNKMDLVDYSQAVFTHIAEDYNSFTKDFGFVSTAAIPLSARYGDNVTRRSEQTAWYDGPTLLEHLETVEVQAAARTAAFRMAVQWVNRPDLSFRGYSGTIASGEVQVGDAVVVAGSGLSTRVSRIVTPQGDAAAASAGDAVTIVVGDEIDISRGDLLTSSTDRPEVADQFAANIVWVGSAELLAGRSYLMRIGAKWVAASITSIKHRIDVNTLEHLAARTLHTNEIGVCNLATTSPIAFDPYDVNRATGAFILVDRETHETAAAGMILFALRRAGNLKRENLAVTKAERAAIKHQRPAIVWLTGLSGSGKSTIAKAVERRLYDAGYHAYMLDGDNLRHGLNRDLGFTDADRVENVRRAGEVARLFLDAGLIVICSFISPFRAERATIRDLVGPDEFVEVFVDTPLEECMRRDPKGLYRKVRTGEITNFTGFDSAYESPLAPEIRLDTLSANAEALADKVVAYLRQVGSIA